MTSPVKAVQESPATPPPASVVEAARYALLRRLAPSMRHHLVVNLQPIGMVYEVMDRRLRAPHPDLGEVRTSAEKINGFARAALDACLDVVTWLAPDEQARTGVSEAVHECLSLLATSLTFRGYAVRNQVGPVPGEIRRSAIRNVLTAAMLHLTDEGVSPADLVLTAQADAAALVLTLTLAPNDGPEGFPAEAPYRKLAWSDVQALAAAESVRVERESAHHVRLFIPWAWAGA